jgi:hypothetical protein
MVARYEAAMTATIIPFPARPQPRPEPEHEPVQRDSREQPLADAIDSAIAYLRAGTRPAEVESIYDLLRSPSEKAGYCTMGPGFASLDKTKHELSAWYGRCRGGKCPACIDAYLHDVIRRAMRRFDFPDTLHRCVVADMETYQSLRRRIQRAEGIPFWTRMLDGSVVVYASVPFPGSEEVPAAVGLLEGLVACDAYPGKAAPRHMSLPKDKRESDPMIRTERLPDSRRVEDFFLLAANDLQRDLDWLSHRRLGRRRDPRPVSYIGIPVAPLEEPAIEKRLDEAKAQRERDLEQLRHGRHAAAVGMSLGDWLTKGWD